MLLPAFVIKLSKAYTLQNRIKCTCGERIYTGLPNKDSKRFGYCNRCKLSWYLAGKKYYAHPEEYGN